MEFQIGDKVGFVYASGTGIVKDKFRSVKGGNVYFVTLYDGTEMFFPEDELKFIEKAVAYTYEIEYLDNVVVARLYEVKDDIKTELAIGHGHIMHEGALGVAQAASYALKRIYMKFEEETYGGRI